MMMMMLTMTMTCVLYRTKDKPNRQGKYARMARWLTPADPRPTGKLEKKVPALPQHQQPKSKSLLALPKKTARDVGGAKATP